MNVGTPAVLVPMPRAGDVVAGKYAVVRVIGEGGMGLVYEAMHVRLRQRVAIKMLLPSMLEHDVLVSRFEREARAAAQLRSRHVARVSDVDFTPHGVPYMVLEYLQGHDLQVELERRSSLPFREAVDYVLQACAAMVEAHGLGIVHRDLKPSNLFLEPEDDRRIVKVLDFGISKLAGDGDAKLTDASTVVGTALYMSPEQVKASHSVDARTDIWSLGMILYELVTGRVPWTGTATQVAAAIVSEDVPDVRRFASVPAELAAIVHKALQRRADHRFVDVRQLAIALAPFASPGSPGRAFGESLVASGSQPRVSIQPVAQPLAHVTPPPSSVERAPTIVNVPAAVSEARMHRRSGTSAGWSTVSSGRGRAALLGASVAIFVGALAIGLVFAIGARRRRATPEPILATTASASEISPVVVEPPLSAPAPIPSPYAAPAPEAIASAMPPPSKTVRPVASARSSAAMPAASKPAAAGDGKPLFL